MLKPVYDHRTGTMAAPEYVRPHPYVVVEGLLNFHSEELRGAHDIRVFLAPPEELRRRWKLTRDCTRRGYTTHEVFRELDARERDVETYIQPQRRHADIVMSFTQAETTNPERLDTHLLLRDSLRHPDLAPFLRPDGDGPTLVRRGSEALLKIPGDTDPAVAAELEEAIWQRMQYASHLRAERLGEFTIGTDLHRSESLALAQTLLLYHLVSTRAEVGAGIEPHRVDSPPGSARTRRYTPDGRLSARARRRRAQAPRAPRSARSRRTPRPARSRVRPWT